MRRFLVLGHEAHTSPDFSLEDIPGTSGRVDVLARCAASVFLLSHGIRMDVELYLVLCGPSRPPRTIRMAGAELRHLNPDENRRRCPASGDLNLQEYARNRRGSGGRPSTLKARQKNAFAAFFVSCLQSRLQAVDDFRHAVYRIKTGA